MMVVLTHIHVKNTFFNIEMMSTSTTPCLMDVTGLHLMSPPHASHHSYCEEVLNIKILMSHHSYVKISETLEF